MDFGARDEDISQELTEGEAFCNVVLRLCFLRWIQIPSFIAKPPDDVRTAVTNRPRQVLEMDFGALDEDISQEWTKGEAFWMRPWFLCEFCVSSLFGARECFSLV